MMKILDTKSPKPKCRVSKFGFRTSQDGVLLIEIILAVAVFGMITLIILSAFTYGREGTAVAGDNSRGAQVANEAIEALHNISQSSYTNLNSYTNGTSYYLDTTGTQWSISTTPKTINNLYTPTIVFAAGPNGSRQATVTVTWRANAQRTGQASATTFLTNYQTATTQTIKTGLLVYANGGTTSNLITYRQLQSNGQWTNPLAMPTAGNSNYVPRSVKMYPAQTGANKMVLARYYDGTKQYIYAFAWNGNTWSTPKQLASWTSSDGLDSGNFSGTYLASGDFIAVYSDNTYKPKYNTMSSGTWSAQQSLPTISSDTTDNPTSMIISARPGTNEAMLGLLGENYQSLTSYYANGAFQPTWTLHASNSNSNSTHDVDFAWSEAGGGIYGMFVYTLGNGQRTPTVRVFTADGAGSGTWGTPMKSTDQPSGSIVISVAVAGQPSGSPGFMVCDKDNSNQQRIYCYSATPTSITNPTNPVLAPTTAPGGQQSMDLGYEDLVGTTGLSGYSDGTTSAKIKRFNVASNTWDSNPVSAAVAATAIEKTRLIPEPGQNDAMLLAIDTQNNLYSSMYNAANNAFYTTPTGYAWTIHNANGPSTAAKWFDFAWDN